jgi:hypothetical protein
VLAANEQLERAIEIFRRVGDKSGLVSSLAAHSGMVSNCDTLPWPAQTEQICRRESAEALALARQIGWPDRRAMVQWLFAVTLAEFGQFGEALGRWTCNRMPPRPGALPARRRALYFDQER